MAVDGRAEGSSAYKPSEQKQTKPKIKVRLYCPACGYITDEKTERRFCPKCNNPLRKAYYVEKA